MKRSGSAVWQGDLKTGKGHISSQSGVLDDAQYGFNTRFEDGPGTNPEELIGAAHAGCFSMALSNIMGEDGVTPDQIATKASVTLEQKDDGFAITKVHLDVTAAVPGMSEQDFQAAAEKAKSGCPVSKLLNAEITMDARLA
ncbi:osmotically inducible protein OsmC [Pseudooceanicola nanhaiensis]|jgi:osmotically inducible protein OsmC|uniref:Osmotically inducible protein OsmC n=1 Tax=Pseudooceanicola nanhaiensis TaxID=375761 RepID=A0A917SIM8_9RHOB|nr:OsmC family protein [Pseudooceanicola nanhaiensis]GGL82940.1 osmotically inducible protein OsmC [Pseudooceanicola nanhaiensis]